MNLIKIVIDSCFNVKTYNDEFTNQIVSKNVSNMCFLDIFDEKDKPIVNMLYKSIDYCVTIKTLATPGGENSFPIRLNYDWFCVSDKSFDGKKTIYGKKSCVVEKNEEAEELKDFFNNAPIALHWLDGNGTIIWANQRELDTLGYTKSEYIGQPIMNFCPDSEDIVLDIFKELGSGNTIRDVPVRFRKKNGDIQDLLIDSNVNYKPDGSFNHTRCFIRDDTSRKIGEARVKATDELRNKLIEDKSKFVSKFIHEIKTPIHILQLSLETENNDISDISSQIKKVGHLVDNVIHAIKFDSNQTISINPSYFKLNKFIKKIVKDFNLNVTLYLDTLNDLVVFKDEKYLKMILTELMDNSILRDTNVSLHVYDHGSNGVMFRVTDHGSIISHEDAHSVFQHYWMSDMNENSLTNEKTLGIGMNVAFNLVECMNSNLEVHSLDKVTFFQFVLENDNIEHQIRSSGSESSESWELMHDSSISKRHIQGDSIDTSLILKDGIGINDSYSRNILLVEDNTICQKVCRRLIEKIGHRCEIASNGKIAVEMVEKNSFIYDLIFMDIRMPVMDGYEASVHISKLNSNIPIIALSAEDGIGSHNKYISCGIIDFIEKPASSKTILEFINKYA